jgi:hypothetical protein
MAQVVVPHNTNNTAQHGTAANCTAQGHKTPAELQNTALQNSPAQQHIWQRTPVTAGVQQTSSHSACSAAQHIHKAWP